MKRIALLCWLLCNLSQGVAKEVAGLSIPETIQRGADGIALVLNGAGVREKFFFDIYVAALYLEQKSNQLPAIIDSDGAARIEMRMLYSEVQKDKFVEGWNSGFSDNLDQQQMSQLQQRLDHFNSWFETLHEGDLVELDYFPGKGTRVRIKDQEMGTIPGADFFHALLKVWLGDKPVTKSLKRDLLGL